MLLTVGEGSSAIYNDDTFAKRLPLLKKWVDQEVELQEVVLDAIQIGVAILKQPPCRYYLVPKSL